LIAVVAISLFSLILKNPPEAYVPSGSVDTGKKSDPSRKDYSWREILGNSRFYLLWVIYLLSATAGLMLIGHIASIAYTQAAWNAGFVLVVVLSAFNASGRIAVGVLSDRVGRKTAFLLVFLIQAVNMFLFTFYNSIPLLILGAAVAGLAYGSLFSLFPAITADYFGLKNLGVNYGLVFTGWGIAGVIGPILGGMVADKTGSYTLSYIVAGILLIIAVVLIRFMKTPEK